MVFSNWDPLSELCTLNIFFFLIYCIFYNIFYSMLNNASQIYLKIVMGYCCKNDVFQHLKRHICTKQIYAMPGKIMQKINNCLLLIPWHLQNWYFKRKNINYATEFCYLINLKYCGIWILQRIWTWELVELAPWSAWTFNLNVWKWFFR